MPCGIWVSAAQLGHDAPDLLETWAMIEQARGTLMARYRCGLEGAFGLLRRAFRAANGGSPAHQNWYYNLKAHPQITVEAGPQTSTVAAEDLDATARAELWPKLVAEWPRPAAGSPDLGAAQAKTTRQFPVFLLTRQDSPEETTISAQSPEPSITAETVPGRRDALTADPSPAVP